MKAWSLGANQEQNDGPRYLQVASSLREAIDEHRFRSGEALPSEHQLCELFGVSRTTIRRAIDKLTTDGILARRHGMGTFVVARPVLARSRLRTFGFTERMRRLGLTPSSRVLESVVLPASTIGASTIDVLRVMSGAPVYRLSRIRFANGDAMMLETSHMALDRFPGIQREDFNVRSIHEVLRERYETEICFIEQTLKPVVIGAFEANLLRVAAGTPGMLIEVVTFDQHEYPVAQGISLVRGDRGFHEVAVGAHETRVGNIWRELFDAEDALSEDLAELASEASKNDRLVEAG